MPIRRFCPNACIRRRFQVYIPAVFTQYKYIITHHSAEAFVYAWFCRVASNPGLAGDLPAYWSGIIPSKNRHPLPAKKGGDISTRSKQEGHFCFADRFLPAWGNTFLFCSPALLQKHHCSTVTCLSMASCFLARGSTEAALLLTATITSAQL